MGSDHFSTRLQPQQQTALTFYAESGPFAFSKSLLTTEDNELDGALKVAVCQAGCWENMAGDQIEEANTETQQG